MTWLYFKKKIFVMFILACYCCSKRLPQTLWLHTIQSYSLTVLEFRILRLCSMLERLCSVWRLQERATSLPLLVSGDHVHDLASGPFLCLQMHSSNPWFQCCLLFLILTLLFSSYKGLWLHCVPLDNTD